MPNPLSLRNYQQDCLEAISVARGKGVRRQLVSLPTGTGKTVCFAHLMDKLSVKKMIVLAHREELLDQAKDKISTANPDLCVEVEQADRRCSPLFADVVVASVATIGRKGSPRLEQFDPSVWGKLVVCDEAHHSVAQSYTTVFDHFGLREETTDSLLVGFTATPRRGDKVGLDSVYQEIVYHKEIREMIDAGWLSPIMAYRIRTNADLSGVRVVHGDFVDSELSEAVNTVSRNTLAVESYKTYCEGRRALVFCVDKQHSRDMAAEFERQGISSGVVLGDTPPDERAQTLADLETGKISVVTNCMVLTEGFDLPALSAVIMARPTKSGLLYTQCIGRGTRLCEGKADLIVIDLTDNSRNHALASLPTLFGLPPDFNLKGKSATKTLTEIENLAQTYPNAGIATALSMEDVQKRIESFDILKTATIPDAVVAYSKLAWSPTSEDAYALFFKDKRKVALVQNMLGKWEITDGETSVNTVPDISTAFTVADQYINEHFADQLVLYSQSAAWRTDGASDKQKTLLTSLGVSFPDTISKGQASILISKAFASRKR